MGTLVRLSSVPWRVSVYCWLLCKHLQEAGEEVPQLRVCLLAKDMGLILSTHMAACKHS
ncbi:hypothetical protein I79_010327 [Cricetulus griseus]|uniref:Uncharacterized protein n=1 Tax=Cricetulus griseus TaxID=10029 RepID=G3HI60_CRIGR|nr:hypothetical protein I79_010327 [Cricetulus griseus]